MNLKDTDKAALLVLLGIAICVLSIFYIAKPNYEAKQSLDSECAELQARLTKLQALEADRPKYEAGIEEYSKKYQQVLDAFPADLNQEITIMFLQGIKDSNEFTIATLGLEEKTPFYTLGTNTSATLPAEGASAEGETDTEAAAADTAAADTAVLTEDTTSDEDDLVCYSAGFPMSYSGSYESLKDVVSYIDTYSDRMTVDSLSIIYSAENDSYAGDLILTCYSVEGESRPERSIELEQVETGVNNIFEGTNGGGAANTLNKYDDMDGAAIETSYDFYMMLNAASSDVSAKVLGQNGTGKENTVVSGSDNTVSVVSYDFYELDGKNYCRYTLDNDKYYEAEVTSAEDVKLLIQSSERKNDDDKVGVKVTIRNSTSLPIYVKVSGDDAVSPRVTIAKTGAVKVYQ